MRITTALFAAALIGGPLVLTPFAHAAKPPTRPSEVTGPTNAALVYARAWLLLNPDDSKKFTELYKSEAGWVPDAEAIKLLEENQTHLDMVMRAASMRDCDWGIDYDKGFEALISHVTPLRRDARMLDADAARLAKTDPEAAARRLAAMFGMARQGREDGILISSLVGTAIAKSATVRAGWMLDQHFMTPAAAEIILNAARALPTDDPFGVRSSIASEGVVMLESVKRNYTGPDAGRRFLSLLTRDGDEVEGRAAVEAMNGEQLAAAMEQAARYYTDVVAVWERPDAASELAAIAEREEQYGPLAPVVAPAFNKGWTSQNDVKQQVAALVQRLEKAAK